MYESLEYEIDQHSCLISFTKGRALRKVEELSQQLDIAKANYRQLGGTLQEDTKKREMEQESARYSLLYPSNYCKLHAHIAYKILRKQRKIQILSLKS